MTFDNIVDTETASEHLEDPAWRFIDCRFDLADTEAGREAYRKSHIPGALYAHLDEDLSHQHLSGQGRHPLPSQDELISTFTRWGIDPDTQVVCYDRQQNAIAARLWFLLRWMGHERVAVLDGGWDKWLHEKHPTTHDTPPVAAREFQAREALVATITAEEIMQPMDDELQIIDVRGAQRFAGEEEPTDPVAGHIPGAINLPYPKNLDAHDCFLPAEALQAMYQRIFQDTPASRSVFMCGSGVTACHSLIALHIAAIPGARLYAGSWSDWIQDPARPVEIGLDV